MPQDFLPIDASLLQVETWELKESRPCCKRIAKRKGTGFWFTVINRIDPGVESDQQLFDHVTVDVGEPVVTALEPVRQLFMIEAEQM